MYELRLTQTNTDGHSQVLMGFLQIHSWKTSRNSLYDGSGRRLFYFEFWIYLQNLHFSCFTDRSKKNHEKSPFCHIWPGLLPLSLWYPPFFRPRSFSGTESPQVGLPVVLLGMHCCGVWNLGTWMPWKWSFNGIFLGSYGRLTFKILNGDFLWDLNVDENRDFSPPNMGIWMGNTIR